MIQTVCKRDGKLVPYDENKIYSAISCAFIDVYKELTPELEDQISNIVDTVSDRLEDFYDTIHIETIQDIIEKEIEDVDFRVAKSYIIYRYTKTLARNNYEKLMDSVSEKLGAVNVENQNANVDERSFGGRTGSMASLVAKHFALKNKVSPMALANHENNMIYIHDLDNYAVGSHNCLTIPIDTLLAKGFNTRQCDVRPANSVSTACQLIAVIMQIQSLQQFGGVSVGHCETTLIPYVRKSFRKHYILEYLKDNNEFGSLDIIKLAFETYSDGGIVRNRFDDWIDTHKEEFYTKTGLADKDFYLDNKNGLNPKYYNAALLSTITEIKQGIEGLFHNLNTLQSRSGNQLPFSSINYGTSTETEGRLVTKIILESCIVGVGKLGRTSVFPCGIFQYSKDINGKPGTPNYDLYQLACKSTAKRLYPNYCNVDWSVDIKGRMMDVEHKRNVINNLPPDKKTKFTIWVRNNPEDAKKYKIVFRNNEVIVDETIVLPVEISSTMGCRTYNGYDINFDFNYVIDYIIEHGTYPEHYLFSGNQKDGRGNICPVTIIMPTLAMMVAGEIGNKDIDAFFELLDKKIHEAKDMLIERFEYIASQSMSSARFMYENGTMFGYDGNNIRSALKHGTLALGNLGLAETLQILVGCDHTSPKGMEIAKRIYQLFNTRCAEFKHDYGLNIGVYNTPAENLCFTAMTKFKNTYGVIPNVSENKFFTNSMHVPVWHECTMAEKIDIESQLTGYSNAGCITYIENNGYGFDNPKGLEKVITYAMDKDIPYFAVNVPNDTCNDCGYTGVIEENCPVCNNNDISRLRRVTGYLTGNYTTAFNEGKQQEVELRVKHGTF